MDPAFDNPPVVERVIGVQFEELNFLRNAHIGWFWKKYLDEEWTHVNEAPKIESKLERFGSNLKPSTSSPFRLMTEPPVERHQIIRKSDDRMIQIQNTRFLLNWREKDTQEYPDFEDILDEFFTYFEKFKSFIAEASDESLKFNQWEVTYINHIPKGVLWENINDWKKVFPFLSFPNAEEATQSLDTMNANWSFSLPAEVGRLHVSLKHAITGVSEFNEVILLDLTSRGPIEIEENFKNSLTIGHNAIVNSFANITSKIAHEHWRRTS